MDAAREVFPDAERRRIFLACKGIFSGPHANFRKEKTIRKCLKRHENALRSLSSNYDLDHLVILARNYLKRGLFNSNARAELEFPGLFAPSLGPEPRSVNPREEVSRTETEALERARSGYATNNPDETGEPVVRSTIAASPTPSINRVAKRKREDESDQTVTPGRSNALSFSSFFTYPTQHCILTTVQQVLEEGIFDFMKRWVPEELARNNWDCASAVELNRWTKILVDWSSRLPESARLSRNAGLDAIVPEVTELRHIAVHRRPIAAQDVSRLVFAAQKLAEVLDDEVRALQLRSLHHDIEDKIIMMKCGKDALDDSLAAARKNIQLQREALCREEEELEAKAIDNDKQNRMRTGILLEESMARIFRSDSLVTHSEIVRLSTADEKSTAGEN
ncbi:uncharacterized protein BO97DRAFT_450621 [Aspergillus homomorphus CBS 101889]|uniref:Ubiquinol-cytochrome-c reductase cytochrome c1 n=1 Tax=Aspergillus homomorphus (strain CBS 101889) TaxID=1450537 RepID=A0A395I1Z9_ASPHC|nr:hypothetical protein BO97DRAFT_450621 [Aspergillus homomorphus CBS 101889]RAL13198.1 hypothetical protein BO97DRAFT_450621 [Aspergillus homomorphus CBS 101889]